MNHLKTTIALLTFILFATCSLQAQEVIIGESGFDAFNTMPADGGIALKIIETANTNMVKKVGYRYQDNNGNTPTILFTVNPNGYAFLIPPTADVNEGDDFVDNEIVLFDENNNRIGHINFSYSFKYEGNNSRQAILFFHNDGEIFGGDLTDNDRYFPYHRNSPNNIRIDGRKVRYNYYRDGEYPVSMLIPPHYRQEEYIREGYRLPTTHDKKPVLFIHGLTGTFSHQDEAQQINTEDLGDQVSYWFDTERKLNAITNDEGERKFHAWQYYYPNEDDLVHCGMMLKKAVEYILDDLSYTEPLNFVAHSMGGLVTMDFLTRDNNYDSERMGKVILSMSPIHGSLGSNRFYGTLLNEAGKVAKEYIKYVSDRLNQDGRAPCYRDMSIGSAFLLNLHSSARPWSAELINNTFSLIGLTRNDYKLPSNLHTEASNHQDGIVSFSSGSLLSKNIGLLGYYGNHDDGKYSKTIADTLFLPNLLAHIAAIMVKSFANEHFGYF
jgi:pimeloyl-ACP methyl ester carboxylesterase